MLKTRKNTAWYIILKPSSEFVVYSGKLNELRPSYLFFFLLISAKSKSSALKNSLNNSHAYICILCNCVYPAIYERVQSPAKSVKIGSVPSD